NQFSFVEGKLIIVINDNSKLSIVINDNVNYSKEIYTDQFFNFITSQSIINHLESNEDSLNIIFKELSLENSESQLVQRFARLN
ncbi:18175_t:CDS:1, partial [Gigaspora rosea]